MREQTKKSIWLALILAVSGGAACQPPTGNSAINTTANTNFNASVNVGSANTSSANTKTAELNANTADISGVTIETGEPEQYQAVVTLKFEVSGAQNLAVPPIKANVARSGANRRMEFTMPNGEKLIYLDIGGRQFVVSQNRRQYAELNKESIGVDPRRMLMPEQIVNQIKNLKGVERVGEEKVGSRDAIKYRYGATTDTKSPAGTVQTESVVLIDKETSLPLRSVTNSTSPNGSVQGIKGLSFVTEMSDVKTTADASLFAEPTDFKKVPPEAVKAQVDMIFSAAASLFGQLMKTAQPTP